MKQLVIAIDPDVDKSGIAFLLKEDRQTSMAFVKTDKFFDLLDFLTDYMIEHLSPETKCKFVVEAGWLNQITNYHGVQGRAGGRVSYQVGRNHQVGILLLEWAEKYSALEAIAAKPLQKCWKGKDGKITQEELAAICQYNNISLPTRTNQEMRDAALLAIVYANLPIRLKV